MGRFRLTVCVHLNMNRLEEQPYAVRPQLEQIGVPTEEGWNPQMYVKFRR